jgi:hypothetical protein
MIDSGMLRNLGWSEELIHATEEAAGLLATSSVEEPAHSFVSTEIYVEPFTSGDIFLDEHPVASPTLKLR